MTVILWNQRSPSYKAMSEVEKGRELDITGKVYEHIISYEECDKRCCSSIICKCSSHLFHGLYFYHCRTAPCSTLCRRAQKCDHLRYFLIRADKMRWKVGCIRE